MPRHTHQPSALNRLIDRLSRLPGIGRRSAQRLAFYLLKQPPEEAQDLAAAIANLKQNVRHCRACFNLSEQDPCPVCADPKRDASTLLVVEQPSDVATFEAAGIYQGLYHVLMGRLSPLDGVGPGELNIEPLIQRIQPDPHPADGSPPGPPPRSADPANHRPSQPVREVILGMDPTLEGDGTALYLAQRLGPLEVKVSRLARGMPTGSSLEMVSKAVLSDSIQGRQPLPID